MRRTHRPSNQLIANGFDDCFHRVSAVTYPLPAPLHHPTFATPSPFAPPPGAALTRRVAASVSTVDFDIALGATPIQEAATKLRGAATLFGPEQRSAVNMRHMRHTWHTGWPPAPVPAPVATCCVRRHPLGWHLLLWPRHPAGPSRAPECPGRACAPHPGAQPRPARSVQR